MQTTPEHDVVAWKTEAARVLDVRPDLAAGGDPLSIILGAAAQVPAHQSLVIIAPFEPAPLYGVLSAQGFAHDTVRVTGDEWVVRFLRESGD